MAAPLLCCLSRVASECSASDIIATTAQQKLPLFCEPFHEPKLIYCTFNIQSRNNSRKY